VPEMQIPNYVTWTWTWTQLSVCNCASTITSCCSAC